MVHVYRIYPKRRKNIFGNFSVNTNIIFINLICFVAFSFLITYDVKFLDYIALKPLNILGGKYLWTFLTSMFMHAGFFHIFANMFSLFFIGSLVQKILGQRRYLYFYLICGLLAGIFFVLSGFFFQDNLNTYAVGASGALFGLVGFLVIITPNLPVFIMFIPIPIKMKYAGPGILIVLWLISKMGNVPIGNMAPLGGLICGLVYGIYLTRKYRNKTRMIKKYFS